MAPQNILVITYWGYDDALVQNYTLPYLDIIAGLLPEGSRIHLVTLEKGASAGQARELPGQIVHHPFVYQRFGLKGMAMVAKVLLNLLWLIRKVRVDTIHAWCMPAGALGYLLSVLSGRPLVLDSYEPHAESMVENGTWPAGGIAFRILFSLERAQSRRASAIIATTAGMREYAKSRYGLDLGPMQVKPACVDLDRFSKSNIKVSRLQRDLGLENKLVAVYAGKFGGIYLDQEVFDLLRVARDHWGDRFHVLLLTAHSIQELEPFMMKAGLPTDLFTVLYVPPHEVPDHMGLADLALTPVKSVPTKRYCTPIKDGEYWALGLPVLITPDISDDSAIIRDHSIGSVLSGLDPEAYLRSIKEIDVLLQRYTRDELYDLVRPVAVRYRSFELAREAYKNIYGSR